MLQTGRTPHHLSPSCYRTARPAPPCLIQMLQSYGMVWRIRRTHTNIPLVHRRTHLGSVTLPIKGNVVGKIAKLWKGRKTASQRWSTSAFLVALAAVCCTAMNASVKRLNCPAMAYEKSTTKKHGGGGAMVFTVKANPSCCPLRPRTTPFPEEKSILGVIYGVLLWADMNAATPLGARGRSVMSLDCLVVAAAWQETFFHNACVGLAAVTNRMEEKTRTLPARSNQLTSACFYYRYPS